MFFQGSSTKVPKEYINYKLCKTFGWTYKQLMNQPSDFINEMISIINIEEKNARYY